MTIFPDDPDWGPNEERAYALDPTYRAWVDARRIKAAELERASLALPEPPAPQPAPEVYTKAEVTALVMRHSRALLKAIGRELRKMKSEISKKASAERVSEIQNSLEARITAAAANWRRDQ